MKKLAIFVVLGLATSAIASADIIVALNSGPVVNGGNFNWTYTATLKSGSTLNTGDFFTLYDIGGFGLGVPIAGNVILPGANWSSAIQLIGVNGFGQAPVDSASIFNVTYTFTGGSPINAAVDTVLGGGAGAFGYTSSSNTSFTGAFSATSHITSGGAAAGNTSSVTVAGAAPSQVPEPSTTLLSGVGLIGLSLLMRRRRRAE
jgi:hypothetical protein